jgi:hypothetical protein
VRPHTVTSTPQRAPAFCRGFSYLAPGSQRALRWGMAVWRNSVAAFVAPLAFLSLATSLTAGQSLLRDAAETNVNQRYLIESISFAGVELPKLDDSRLPSGLRAQLSALIGQRCDTAALENLAAEIRKQLHFRAVTEHLSKGSGPEQVRVNFEVVRKDLTFDVSLPKFLYHSNQGFSGEVDASTTWKQNTFTFGVVSNGDDLTERYSGVTARFQSEAFGSEKIRAGLTFEDYHEQWNQATTTALEPGGPELYRARWNVAPEVTFEIAPPITVAVGASFQQTESEIPGEPGRAANAATLDVRFHKHQFEGRYSLRLATKALGSGYSYARHLITIGYQVKTGRHGISDELMAGSIEGNAPFFERFVLGSSSTLRGWDRYQIDPLGGSRVVHNEISYSYRVGDGTVEAFYDSGMLWQSDRAAQLRHSLGVGYKQGVFVMTLAFPLRDGRVEPVFMAGMNY